MNSYTDREMDDSIATMLRNGVILAAFLVVFGGFLYLRQSATSVPDYSHFSMGTEALRSLGGVLSGVMRLDAESVIQLGSLVLIATPVARVAYCVVGFARQRDRLYVGISCGVLAVLLYSLIKGGR